MVKDTNEPFSHRLHYLYALNALVLALNPTSLLIKIAHTNDLERRQIASSFGATQVLFNPKIPEVASLQKRYLKVIY